MRFFHKGAGDLRSGGRKIAIKNAVLMLEPCKLVTKDLLGWFRGTLKDFKFFWFFQVIAPQNVVFRSHQKWKNLNISAPWHDRDKIFFLNWLFFSQQFDKNVFLCFGGHLPLRYFDFSFFVWSEAKILTENDPKKSKIFKILQTISKPSQKILCHQFSRF